MSRKTEENLIAAAAAVWKAYLLYGPVEDGTRKGKAFEAALDVLMEAFVASEVELKHKARKARPA